MLQDFCEKVEQHADDEFVVLAAVKSRDKGVPRQRNYSYNVPADKSVCPTGIVYRSFLDLHASFTAFHCTSIRALMVFVPILHSSIERAAIPFRQ